MNGVVDFAEYERGLGLHVVLKHGMTLQSIYGHLSQIWVLKDDTVGIGEPIGLTGATGLVTGEHLHFSMKFNNRFLNPLTFLKAVLQRAASHYSLNYANHE
jgi:murein DD-endopeptidase MepM/ murein hydrolase activator NlpD